MIPPEVAPGFHAGPGVGKVRTQPVCGAWWESQLEPRAVVLVLGGQSGDFLTFDSAQLQRGCLAADEERRMWVQRPGVALSAEGGCSGTAQELILQLLLQRCSTSVPPTAAGAGDNDSCYGHSPTFHVERQGSHGTETGMGHLCPFHFLWCEFALRTFPLGLLPSVL